MPVLELPGLAPTVCHRYCCFARDRWWKTRKIFSWISRKSMWLMGPRRWHIVCSVTALKSIANVRLIFIDFHFFHFFQWINTFCKAVDVVAAVPHSYSILFSINFAISSLSVAEIDRMHTTHTHTRTSYTRTTSTSPCTYYVDGRHATMSTHNFINRVFSSCKC